VTNLGYLFTNGLQRRIVPEVLTGVLAVVVVAVIVDLLLIGAGRLLLPWQRTVNRRAHHTPTLTTAMS